MATIAVLLTGLTASLVWVALLRRAVAQRTARWKKSTPGNQIEQRRLLEQERTRVAGSARRSRRGPRTDRPDRRAGQRPNTAPARARDHLFVITEKSRDMIAVLDEIVLGHQPETRFCHRRGQLSLRLRAGFFTRHHHRLPVRRHPRPRGADAGFPRRHQLFLRVLGRR